MKTYQEIAARVHARLNCIESGNNEWMERHEQEIERLIKQYMPSGSGWDSGTQIDLEVSGPEKIVFRGSYHHMNDGGYYDGWTDHTITVTPSLQFGFQLKISGRDRNQIKDYLYEMFQSCLDAEICDEKAERAA